MGVADRSIWRILQCTRTSFGYFDAVSSEQTMFTWNGSGPLPPFRKSVRIGLLLTRDLLSVSPFLSALGPFHPWRTSDRFSMKAELLREKVMVVFS